MRNYVCTHVAWELTFGKGIAAVPADADEGKCTKQDTCSGDAAKEKKVDGGLGGMPKKEANSDDKKKKATTDGKKKDTASDSKKKKAKDTDSQKKEEVTHDEL